MKVETRSQLPLIPDSQILKSGHGPVIGDVYHRIITSAQGLRFIVGGIGIRVLSDNYITHLQLHSKRKK